MEFKFDVVVTRHQDLVEFLREIKLIGPDTVIKENVESVRQIACNHILGVLPIALATKAA